MSEPCAHENGDEIKSFVKTVQKLVKVEAERNALRAALAEEKAQNARLRAEAGPLRAALTELDRQRLDLSHALQDARAALVIALSRVKVLEAHAVYVDDIEAAMDGCTP